MRRVGIRVSVPLALLTACGLAASSWGQEPASTVLDRATVVDLAKRRAPDVRLAEVDVEIARGRVVGARVFARQNPVLDGAVGRRWNGEPTTDVEGTLAVPIELWGQRGKRIAVAEGELARDQRLAEDARRRTVGAALADYYRVLHAAARLELAGGRRRLADELIRTARERFRVGGAAQFEVNLAEAEVARAESDVLAGEADLTGAKLELADVLGLANAFVEVAGDLGDRSLFDGIAQSESGATRPDVLAAVAGADAAARSVTLADLARWPEISLRVTYAREERSQVLLGGLALTLPIFERGQGERREARAREQRAAIELETRRAQVAAQVPATRRVYDTEKIASQALAERAVPRAIENEAMALASYRAGKLDLVGLLLVRREVLDTRREHVDRLLDAALAGVDLLVTVGAIP